jgi:Protein of unknown function (DUF3995)
MALTIIGILLSSIFAFLGGIHFYWGLGGKWGMADAVPKTREGKSTMAPGMVASFVVGFGLIGFGMIEAMGAGLLDLGLPAIVSKVGLWVIVAIFSLRAIGEFKYVGFFKKVRDTAFGRKDSLYCSPLCLLIAALTGLVIALG